MRRSSASGSTSAIPGSRLPGGPSGSSGSTPTTLDLRVGKRLDDAPAEGPFQVAVAIESERFEPGELRLLRGTLEQLEEVRQRRRELAVGRQRHLVDVGLRARDGVVIEAREPCGDLVDLGVEPVVG